MKILLATNNLNKEKEIAHFLLPLNIDCLTPADLNIKLNVCEDGSSFAENALLKAQAFSKVTQNHYPVLSDDSGLCVEVLKGRPGLCSARYGQTSSQTHKISDFKRNQLLLSELEHFDKPRAHFVTHLCLYFSPYCYIAVEENLEGYIAPASKTKESYGFGYDPIFYVKENNRSLSEHTLEEKNKISSRGKALRKLCCFLKESNWIA